MQQRLAICFCWFILMAASVTGQQCNNRFSAFIYNGISYDSFTCAINGRTNEILATACVDQDQAFAARFSANGTVLFSYQYYPVYQFNTTYYKSIKYTQAIQTKDGGYVLAGQAVQDKFVFTREYINQVGLLLKIDAFGNVAWCQLFESANGFRNGGFDIAATNVLETTNGDLIIYVASDYGSRYPSYGRIVCFDANGTQKWNTLLAGAFTGGLSSLDVKRGLVQTSSGTVAVCDLVYQTDRSREPGKTLAAGLHFFGIAPNDGKIKWETNYAYPLGPNVNSVEVTSAAELPNRHLVFTTSYLETGGRKKPLRITVNDAGVLQSALSFETVGNGNLQLLSAAMDATGNQTCLFKGDAQSVLVKITGNGTLRWTQGFSNVGGLYPANCMTTTQKGYSVFGSNFKNRNIRLLLTDTTGVVDCANEIARVVVLPFVLEPGVNWATEPNTPDQNRFGSVRIPVRAEAYPLQKTIVCQAQADCCTDVVDSTSKPLISICEGKSYTLPDNTTVNKSGTYFITYKSARGCDSVVYYRINVDKNVNALTAGDDLCFNGKDSVVLTATEGYETYRWMGAPGSSNNFFVVRRPGAYRVSVQNSCGQKTDTVNVYNECEFPIYMPSAFTPNNDGRNDIFGLPSQNKNHFVSLKIFNRWGQVVFKSTNAQKGWDGVFNHLPQPNGIYVYYLEMESLSEKKLTQKGTVLLIR